MTLRAEAVDELIGANVVMQISDVLTLPLCVLFLLLFDQINRHQAAHSQAAPDRPDTADFSA